MDDSGNVTLFRIPEDILLKLNLGTTTSTPAKTDFTALPYDIVFLIFKRLDLADLTCLALTCKALARLVTCSTRLPAVWQGQREHVDSGGCPRNRWPLYISITPEWYTLLPRLAKGWVPKDKFKYCWKCNRIYPRDRTFYETALSKERVPGWLWKLNISEREWRRMASQERYEHMISRWLDDDPLHESLHPPAPVCSFYYPDLGIWATHKSDARGPECPLCLERELMYSRRTPESRYQFASSTRRILIELTRVPVDLGNVAWSTVMGALRFRYS